MKTTDKPGDQPMNLFDKTAVLLEQNIRGVQLGIYSVALCGLGIALRSVRPFAKFAKPSQIPAHFYRSHIKLSGKVVGIESRDKRSILLVDHSPIIGAKLRRKETRLPVQVEGINVTSNGVCWLQTIVRGENVQFVLMTPHSDSAGCLVYHNSHNIANQLVSIGFASVAPYNINLDNDKLYKKYYQSLLKDEAKAEKKNIGMWYNENKSFGANIYKYFRTTSKMLKINAT